MPSRDDFSASTRRTLAERAGQRCSNPYCGHPTSGASDARSSRSTVLGKAAHITAAAKGGARYDPSLTTAQRTAVANGIWLCAECADRVDKPANAEAYPVELLRWWKALQEEMSGTDMASVEARRRYPLRRLSIDNVAGVQGNATIDFGALTLIKGTSKLSRSVGELVQIFCDRVSFTKARQPVSGDSFDHARIPQPDGQDLVVTVQTEWRSFTAQGKLWLLLSDGREFECVVTRHGAQFSASGVPLPSFSPTCRTVAVLEDYKRYIYPGPWSSEADTGTLEERIAAYFNVSVQELLACMRGTAKDHSIFGFDYSVDADGRCHVKCGRHAPHLPVAGLSSGEKSRVILDIAVRIAAYATKVSPVVLLVHQCAVPLDGRGISCFLKWIESTKPPFQTVMDIVDPRLEPELSAALCYEARGADMDVTAFELVPLSRFCRKETP